MSWVGNIISILGLTNTAIATILDTDLDTVQDANDACRAEFQGCQAAVPDDDDLHVHYHKTTGFAGIEDKGKEKKHRKLPLALGLIGDSRGQEIILAIKNIYLLDDLLVDRGLTSFNPLSPLFPRPRIRRRKKWWRR